MIPVFIGATVLSASSNWWAVATGRRAVERVAKPLTLMALIATAVVAGALGSVPGLFLLAGLVFGLVGDVALLGEGERSFLVGLSAFLVGHIGYAVALALVLAPWWPATIVGTVVVASLLIAVRGVLATIWREQGSALGAACAVYATVIATMGVLAWLTGDFLIGAGATIFIVSDALLARGVAKRGFEGSDPREHTAVMVTYHVGQAALVAGVLLAVG